MAHGRRLIAYVERPQNLLIQLVGAGRSSMLTLMLKPAFDDESLHDLAWLGVKSGSFCLTMATPIGCGRRTESARDKTFVETFSWGLLRLDACGVRPCNIGRAETAHPQPATWRFDLNDASQIAADGKAVNLIYPPFSFIFKDIGTILCQKHRGPL